MKNMFTFTKEKIVITLIIFIIFLFITPCSSYGEMRKSDAKASLIICSASDLLDPYAMVYDSFEYAYGIFPLYKTQFNFIKYSALIINLAAAYLIACLIISILRNKKK